jgi:hypothetical protein
MANIGVEVPDFRGSSDAFDATWTGGNAGDPNEWVEPLNWVGGAVPNGTATFNNASVTTVANDNGGDMIGTILFTAAPNAQAYTVDFNNPAVITALGIVNNSTNLQTFNVASGSSMVFQNASSASGEAPGPLRSTTPPAVSSYFRTPARPVPRPSSIAPSRNSTTPAPPAARTSPTIPIRDMLTEGFSHFVSSMTAPVASGWSGCRVVLAPTGKRRLCTAHTHNGHGPLTGRSAEKPIPALPQPPR